ncbi:GNAT family N-acetyltransferase [Caldibacillus lycopersici]|uniref:GNAT family N-acetyltransferase n=1 Tax=Perspicuibacillus lycopersici TaxID=1325689 RepID=A0AAE3LTL2_9BACI|nr:GNAT family N-acetyltransferase [Perspicuibacillus lycopersici]MCU9614173.1 GNAT family N-acetyltransferase [Perspicuibacillus lycopersici]
MLQIRKMHLEELEIISHFISELNKLEESHIGYCGINPEEITKYLLEELEIPYQESFLVAFYHSTLIGVLGFDADLKNQTAEIWGPFIKGGGRHANAPLELWKEIEQLLPIEIKTIYMFPNNKNTQALQLANAVGFIKKSEESILAFPKENQSLVKKTAIAELSPDYVADMQQLHDEIFPNTYYSGKQIIERLNDYRKIFIATNLQSLAGYIYVEVDPLVGEASIEFFAVKEVSRGNGIGGQLLAGAIAWIFTFEHIHAITLCVNRKKEAAIRLYKKAGFLAIHNLSFLSKEILR